ncbi:peptide/nickel transport system substrate-binding protein [Actinokineospora alba]|uniref:Peptide/nickel transport system substrate-binding protein n=1 Tax=Actinokineospora alba TaxID=504798 RepID=A0A1H0EMX2_9PSEU|nr:ABC transporter family substrate-binding protein [Actinokineospora alba]TDP69144.1 peptide/nickel transport system substrate-binding protein [Actinokineospora alba]SDI23361.1 peptide/nickel transport system substrate-binding protein [Actinokineospora alba]SDN83700.1 peptide/nickel transport system substrate-binding protein [Actinokineospora alba]
MRFRGAATALGGAFVAATVALSGCATGGPATAQGERAGGDRPQVNAQPRSALRDGGDLRVPIDALPTNYNPKQVNGARVVNYQIAEAILPTAFVDGADGVPVLNRNFFDKAEIVATAPQVVRYTIAADAVWSNGRPLSWEDLRGHWRALKGEDTRYEVNNHVGYQDVASVERGASDKEAVLTFTRPYADWPGLFRPLVPKELTESPEVFNKGWLTGPTVTSGPFELAAIDATAKTITLRRNAKWWREQPPLDRVIFRVLAPAARADELANRGIDIYPIGADLDLFTRASNIPGVEIRQATERRAGQLTFNGGEGALLSDEALRTTIARGIDPQAVTTVLVGPMVRGAKAVGNHVLPPGYAGYKDNSSVAPFDANAAKAKLDELGWKLEGKFRAKGGKPLSLRFVVAATPTGRTVSGLIAEQLAAIGVEAKVESVPAERFHDTYLLPGNFDLIAFDWTKSPYPISHDRPVFQQPVGTKYGNNFGRVHIPGIEALYDRAIAELDPAKRDALANEIDVLAWRHAHHLPLYPESGAYAVRKDLANYGARGLGAYGFATAGFLK